ncbi:MAG: tetratricopeptide repeat protein, partial [Cyclobacteriaceae bacterium]|nr:tetratricopeptide repeat protein [Cyclobacteriaceae bacterium]
MRFLYLFLLLLFNYAVYSQNADSVTQKLNAYKQEDSVKVEMLIDACVNQTFSANERTLAWAEQAKSIAEKIKYKTGLIRSLNCIGNYYYQRGLYDKSLLHYLDALKLAEKGNDTDNILIGKSNVANVFTHTKRLPEAIALFKACDQILINKQDTLTQKRAAILTNLATAYSANQQHDSAIYFYIKVYAICGKLNIGFGLGLTQSNLASEYFTLGKYEKALEALQQAEAYSKKFGLDFLDGNIYKTYGRVYLKLGDVEKGIGYLEQALTITQRNKDLSVLASVYQELYLAEASNKNYQKAFDYAAKFISVNDSLFNINKEKKIAELNTQYETEKKELMIQQLQQENKISELQAKQRGIQLIALIGFCLFIVVAAYLLFLRYKIKKENQALQTQITHEQNLNKSILTSIKSQMNPHFFYNALNTIQSYIFSDDKRNASAYLSKFSALTRMILEMSEKDRINIAQEIKALTLYLDIEKARFNDDFNFHIEV